MSKEILKIVLFAHNWNIRVACLPGFAERSDARELFSSWSDEMIGCEKIRYWI
ncbi:MAG: hypothetical protein JRE20_04905 [Deltaproteobacteria bacterium]|nr:hypothetical protein [Deltaproteobacteria bacterium]